MDKKCRLAFRNLVENLLVILQEQMDFLHLVVFVSVYYEYLATSVVICQTLQDHEGIDCLFLQFRKAILCNNLNGQLNL